MTPAEAATIVMLHQGERGDPAWAGFGEALAAATGCRVFQYARAEPALSGPALETLPKLLETIGFQRGILLGQGEGASIATVYLGGVQDHRVRGLVLISPRFFTPHPTGNGEQAPDIRESIGYIRVPMLIVNGTAVQIGAAEDEAYCPVDTAPGGGPADTLAAVAAFIKTVRNED